MQKEALKSKITGDNSEYPETLFLWVRDIAKESYSPGWTISVASGLYPSKVKAQAQVPGYGKFVLVEIQNPFSKSVWVGAINRSLGVADSGKI